MHETVLPLSDEFLTIRPIVNAEARDLVVHPVALVSALVVPGVLAVAVLLAEQVLALELGAVRPNLSASALMEILTPVAFINTLIRVNILSVAVHPIVQECALVLLACRSLHFALALSLSKVPLTRVD